MDTKHAAIYHFTNGIPRNSICENELKRLTEFAQSQGYENIDTFCDIRTTSEEHDALDELLANRDKYNAIIAKDHFHISKYILQAKELVNSLANTGINVITMCDKPLIINNKAPLKKPLRAASYYCHWYRHKDDSNVKLKNDILSCFVKTQTQWKLQDQFFDEEKKGHAGTQEQLQQLIERKDAYDIIVVHSLSSLHWRTFNFCNTRELIRKDIYSLQDGFLQYME